VRRCGGITIVRDENTVPVWPTAINHVHPVAAVQAGAGKTRGPIESLLVEHRQIRQNRRAIGKIVFGGEARQFIQAF
jgi:hypothetical protein